MEDCAFSFQLLLKEKQVGAWFSLLEYADNGWRLLKGFQIDGAQRSVAVGQDIRGLNPSFTKLSPFRVSFFFSNTKLMGENGGTSGGLCWLVGAVWSDLMALCSFTGMLRAG